MVNLVIAPGASSTAQNRRFANSATDKIEFFINLKAAKASASLCPRRSSRPPTS